MTANEIVFVFVVIVLIVPALVDAWKTFNGKEL